MSAMLAVAKRELRAFFTTPIGYIVLGAYALISGLGFTASFLFYARMTQSPSNYGYSAVPDFEENFLSPFLVYCGLLFMFIGPLLTMRLFAEERNQGTIELLFTHPLRDRDIIGGKFFAGLVLVGLMVLNLSVYVFLIYRYTDVEVAVLLLGLLSVLLMGAAILSVGVFVSGAAIADSERELLVRRGGLPVGRAQLRRLSRELDGGSGRAGPRSHRRPDQSRGDGGTRRPGRDTGPPSARARAGDARRRLGPAGADQCPQRVGSHIRDGAASHPRLPNRRTALPRRCVDTT